MYQEGQLTPVYFGSALRNFGVMEMLDGFVDVARRHRREKPMMGW